jgi:hypothetical protein
MPDPTPQKRDPRKMIVALQFWDGDKEKAMYLARLIADLEPVKNEKVDFAFVARFDTKPDPASVEYVSKKFNVWQLTGTRRGTGWPHGCNELALDLFQQAGYRSRKGGEWEHHKALYLIESDVLPMCKDWLSRISDEWDLAQENGKFILGSWSPYHSPVGHCNGNLLVAPDIAVRIKGLDRCPPRAGWDAFFGPKFAPHWWKSVTMQNHYDYRSNIPPEILFSCVDGVTPPAVVHGIKDKSAERQAREAGLI